MSLAQFMVVSGRKPAEIRCDTCDKPLVKANAFIVKDCGDKVHICLKCKQSRPNKVFRRDTFVNGRVYSGVIG